MLCNNNSFVMSGVEIYDVKLDKNSFILMFDFLKPFNTIQWILPLELFNILEMILCNIFLDTKSSSILVGLINLACLN